MARKPDKFGKADIAQLLVGAFVIAEGTYFGGIETTLLQGFLTFLVLLAIASIIFGIIAVTRKGVLLRVLIYVPALIGIATLLELVITGHINWSAVLIHAGTALPISAGIDAIKD